jgi:hypothetical protein
VVGPGDEHSTGAAGQWLTLCGRAWAADRDGGDVGRARVGYGGEIVSFAHGRGTRERWIESRLEAPTFIALRLTPALGGTLVELFHHGFRRTGGAPARTRRLRDQLGHDAARRVEGAGRGRLRPVRAPRARRDA